jgi:hypothetical protein
MVVDRLHAATGREMWSRDFCKKSGDQIDCLRRNTIHQCLKSSVIL